MNQKPHLNHVTASSAKHHPEEARSPEVAQRIRGLSSCYARDLTPTPRVKVKLFSAENILLLKIVHSFKQQQPIRSADQKRALNPQ